MNNKYPQINFVFDRRKTASLTKKASVEMRICYNYKQKFISTGIMLYSNQWKNGKIINCPDIIQISQTLDNLLMRTRQIIMDMMANDNVNLQVLVNKLSNDSTHITFDTFFKERMAAKRYGKSAGTNKRYDCFIDVFNTWNGIKEFEHITDAAIMSFDEYLINKGMNANSRWSNYHKFLNSIIIDAIKEGLCTRNPYKWLTIERDHSNGIKKRLTPNEFRKLKAARMPTESLSRVRDAFVFQTYTCLRYSDLVLFDAKYIKEIKGMKVYIRKAKKTNKPFTVPILSPAWDILMKYEGQLPIISNVKYNLYLKTVAQYAGIDKPLSTHWARHTGATLLINEGVDTQIIKKICGHSSVKITEQIYAELLDETVVDAVQDLDI